MQLFECLMIDAEVWAGAPNPSSLYQSSWSHAIMSHHGRQLIVVAASCRVAAEGGRQLVVPAPVICLSVTRV